MYLLSTAVLLWWLRSITLYYIWLHLITLDYIGSGGSVFWSISLFPNPTVCSPSSQGERCCDKMSQKYCDNNASWSWESKFCNNTSQPGLLILIMKSQDTRQGWRPRISWTERKYLQLESNFLVHIWDIQRAHRSSVWETWRNILYQSELQRWYIKKQGGSVYRYFLLLSEGKLLLFWVHKSATVHHTRMSTILKCAQAAVNHSYSEHKRLCTIPEWAPYSSVHK